MLQYRRMAIERESPEQLGYDMIKYNLAESSISDQIFAEYTLDLSQLVFCYGDHVGHPILRKLIADEYRLMPNHVLLTAGAASALFIVATALLLPQDHILVMLPNYATNIETPRAMGCEIDFINLSLDTGFELDLTAEVMAKLKPNTRLISLTTPNNPTGKMLSEVQLKALLTIAEQHGCWVLVDETYRDLSFHSLLPLAASLSERVISVSSLSKAFGLPGIRIGWLVCKDKTLMELFLAAKEQIIICNSVVDEEIAYQVYCQKITLLQQIHTQIAPKFLLLKQWLSSEKRLDYCLPEGGVVCFPRINIPISTSNFYNTLLQEYNTYVGRGQWFDFSDTYFRIGFGWPSLPDLEAGLNNITMALNKCT